MRISVTALDVFQECAARHAYRHLDRLSLRAAKGTMPLRVGRAVADGLEHRLMTGKVKPLPPEMEEQEQKKVARALGAVPEWVWQVKEPVSEDKLEMGYWQGHVAEDDSGACTNSPQLVGKPDLWYLEQSEGTPTTQHYTGVHVVEFKSTGDSKSKATRKIVQYERWGLQPIRYAVLLYDKYEWLRGLPFYRQHILVTHAGVCYEGRKMLVSQRLIDDTRREMLEIAGLIGKRRDHHFGPLCEWCDFGPICEAWLTGGDPEDMVKQMYEVRNA